MKNKIKQIAKSKILHFLFSKYLVFILQFIKSLYLAVVLGPFYFGIWGFLSLVMQYLSYSNLGVQHSLNVSLSLENNKYIEQKKLSAAITVSIVLSIILLFTYLLIHKFNLNLFSKYQFSKYFIFTIVITILMYFNQILINLYRSYGLLYKIAISDFLFQALSLLVIFFYTNENLLYALLYSMIISKTISIIIFIIKPPIKIILSVNFKEIKNIVNKGFYLLLYNISFYLIMLSSRTIISFYYSVEIMGKYSFANSLAMAILMGLQTIGWIIFPKSINKLKSGISDEETVSLITKLREIYLMVLFILSFSVITIFPFLIQLLPKYSGISVVFILLILSQVIITNNFGYNILLIARKKERKLTTIGFITVSINIGISLFFIKILKLDYQYIALSILISVIYYNYAVVKSGLYTINQNTSFYSIINILLPYKILIPIIIFFALAIFNLYYYSFVGLIVFIVFNYKEILLAINKGLMLFNNPNILKK